MSDYNPPLSASKQAIILAVGKGYELQYYKDFGEYVDSEVFMSPSFWQALGKALGWSTDSYTKSRIKKLIRGDWYYEWHRYIDWIAEGKDPEAFWKELLTKRQ